MSSSSQESMIISNIAGLIRTGVIQPLVSYLNAKGTSCTVEELCSVLKLPGTPVPTTVNSLPPNLTSSVRARPKKTETVSPTIPESQLCQYIFTRGRNKGQRCPEKAEDNGIFCKNCKIKKSAAAQATGPGTSQPSTVPSETSYKPKITVVSFSGSNGLLLETKHNLVIRTGKDPTDLVAIGIKDVPSGGILPLTAEKIEICKQLGLSYVDPSKGNALPIVPSSLNKEMPSRTIDEPPAITDMIGVGDPADDEEDSD